MKVKYFIPAIIALFTLALTSCNDDDAMTLLDEVQVSSSYVSIPMDGGSATITVKANNDEYGSVMGSGTFKENAEVQIAAIPKTGYHFVKWDDDNTDNPRTVKVTKDETYTAIFEADAIPTYTITVVSENEEMGVVMGGGSFKSGEETSIGAIAKEGYEFVQWSDGNTDNPRTITVTKDETYTAQFKVKGEGLDDLNAETMTARKVMINGTIFIRQGDKLLTLQGQEVK